MFFFLRAFKKKNSFCLSGVALVFTALLSVAFLAQSFGKEKWLGMMMIVLGLLIIGLPNLLKNIEDDDKIQHYSLIAGKFRP